MSILALSIASGPALALDCTPRRRLLKPTVARFQKMKTLYLLDTKKLLVTSATLVVTGALLLITKSY